MDSCNYTKVAWSLEQNSRFLFPICTFWEKSMFFAGGVEGSKQKLHSSWAVWTDVCRGLVQRNNGLFIFKSDDLSRPKPLVQQFSASSQARQFHLGHFQEIATVHLRLHLKTASTHVWRISVACYWETNIESECLVQHRGPSVICGGGPGLHPHLHV